MDHRHCRLDLAGFLRCQPGRLGRTSPSRHVLDGDGTDDEADRADLGDVLAEPPQQLGLAQGQLVKPGRVINRDGQAAVLQAPRLRSPSHLRTQDGRPSGAETDLVKSLGDLRERARDQIGHTTRRELLHPSHDTAKLTAL